MTNNDFFSDFIVQAEFYHPISPSVNGTVFLLQKNDRIFGITAKHVLKNRDTESIRITIKGSREPLSIIRAGSPRFFYHSDDDEVQDIMVFEFNAEEYKEKSKGKIKILTSPIDIAHSDMLTPRSNVIVAGYSASEVYYETKKIIMRLDIRQGKIIKQKIMQENIYSIKLKKKADDLNGISGSPVFLKHNKIIKLAGMTIRASGKNAIAHFICSEKLIEAVTLLMSNSQHITK